MKEIKKINKISFAKITGLIYGFVGFLVAVVVAVSTMINIIMQKDFTGSTSLVILFNLGAGLLLAVLTSLITAGLGWLLGYVGAAIYNIFAARAGGVKIELGEKEFAGSGENNNNANN